MNISSKWKAVAAGLLAFALVGGSAVAANATPGDALNPQPNGSEGGLYIYDADLNLVTDPNHVFNRGDSITASSSPTDPMVPVFGDPAKVASSTQVYTFFASEANLRASGKNSWEAYTSPTPYNHSVEQGILLPNLTPGDQGFNNGIGADGVFGNVGGTYYVGVAFTKNNGVTVDSTLYRTMTILADGKYTLSPIEVEGAAVIEDPVASDLTPALEVAGLATTTVDSTVITINGGAALAGKTVNVGAFSTYTDLGQVTLNGTGSGTVDVAGSGLTLGAPHNLVVWDPSNGDVLAWGAFTLATSTPMFGTDSVALTTTVTSSNTFSLNATNASVNLGAAGRDVETAEVALGGFKVIDDRDELRGWNVNVSVADFVGPNAATIASNALGYKVTRVGGVGVATLGADKVAGAGSFGTVASAIAGESTTAAGADFDLGLTFKSPVDAAVGQYNSTLTLDLVSL